MKKEILFRGKRKDNGKWVEGFYFYNKKKNRYYIISKENDLYAIGVINYEIKHLFEVIPETVGQYITYDKQGEEIYTNDIVNIRGHNYVLVFSKKWGRYMAVDVEVMNRWLKEGQPIGDEYDIFGFDEDESRQCVKIGNIFDNPELL